jgi:hypothetical protein
MIETTAYLTSDVLNMLHLVSERYTMNISDIIQYLISTRLQRSNWVKRLWKRVKYQRIQPGRRGVRYHITFSAAEYEMLLDARKIRKESVSFILAQLIEELYNELQSRENADITDNYRPLSYVMLEKVTSKGDLYWEIYWGVPETG